MEFVKDILDGEGINMDMETGDIVTDEDKKIKSDTSATSDDWGDMDEGMESTREVDDDFDMEL